MQLIRCAKRNNALENEAATTTKKPKTKKSAAPEKSLEPESKPQNAKESGFVRVRARMNVQWSVRQAVILSLLY